MKGKVVPVINYAPPNEDVWGCGGIVLCICNVCSRQLGSFRAILLYPPGEKLTIPIEPERRCTIIVFSPDSPSTRSRRSIGSGGESSSMLTSVEGNAVQAFCTRKNASN
jgi:hypothetical protein